MTSLPPPRRRFGQNFLADPKTAARIVETALSLGPGPLIEIGPGRGALTAPLAASGRPLVAIEIDRDLAPELEARFAGHEHVEIVEEDALQVDWRELAERLTAPPIVVGNLPYNVATPIARELFLRARYFAGFVLMFQREVAERLAATAGAEYGYLSIECALATQVTKRWDVPPGAFVPRPKVHSSVVVLRPLADPPPMEVAARVRGLASVGFGARRKQLRKTLLRARVADESRLDAAFERLGLLPTARAEELPPEQWIELALALAGEDE